MDALAASVTGAMYTMDSVSTRARISDKLLLNCFMTFRIPSCKFFVLSRKRVIVDITQIANVRADFFYYILSVVGAYVNGVIIQIKKI